MNERSARTVRRIVVGAIIALPVGYVLYCAAWLFVFLSDDTDGPRVRLLYETDHQALLEACRELSRRVAVGELKSGEYSVRLRPGAQTRTFPQIILDLEPGTVFISDYGEITVEMAGGFDHVGVRAYPESHRWSTTGSDRDHRRLLEGLWYYDDGYEERPDDWDKHLEKLRPKANRP